MTRTIPTPDTPGAGGASSRFPLRPSPPEDVIDAARFLTRLSSSRASFAAARNTAASTHRARQSTQASDKSVSITLSDSSEGNISGSELLSTSESAESSSLASSESAEPSSAGASDSAEDEWDEVKHDVTVALADADQTAPEKFATSGQISHAANPGLCVKGLGLIGLPLSDRDARELVKASHRAPFGKGSDTIVDTKVRKTWELHANQILLRNPQWQNTLSDVVAMVAKELGFVGRDRMPEAQLYKLLLYEEGAFFDCHKDTEKAPGMFGTLVIALPSPHTGGQVVAKFSDHTRCLATEKTSDFGFSYLAWYADVEHSVKPVTSGYRLVLTYNLVASDADPLSATQAGDKTTRVGKILERWQELGPEFPSGFQCLAYVLKHQYTQSNLRVGLLKGKDREHWRVLDQACTAQDLRLYLAQLTYSRSGGCDDDDYYDDGDFHKITEDQEVSLELPYVCDRNGGQIATSLNLEPSHIVQKKAFASAPDEEDYSGWTGNEGVSATHFYRRACLIVLPRSDYVDFIFDSELKKDSTLRTWVKPMLHQCSSGDATEVVEMDLTHICRQVLKRATDRHKASIYYSWPYSASKSSVNDKTLETIAEVSLALAWPAVLSDIAPCVQDAFPQSIYSELGGVVARDGVSKWQRAIETTFASIAVIGPHIKAVESMVRGYKTACAVQNIQPSDLPILDRGIGEQVFDKLGKGGDKPQDPAALIMISSMQEGAALNQKIVPYVKSRLSDVNFVVEFLNLLGTDSQTALESRKKAYGEILTELARRLTFAHLHGQQRQPLSFSGRYNSSSYRTLDKEAFARLLQQSVTYNLTGPVCEMLEKLEIGARNASPDAFEAGIFPLMRLVFHLVREDTGGPFFQFFCGLVDASLDRFIGPKPLKPLDWTKNACGCGCAYCRAMDEFLVHPKQAQMRLEKFIQHERKHLIERIRCADCDAEPDRRQSPHALVLTKTFSGWKRDLQSWKKRLDSTMTHLRKLTDQTSMEKLLGDRYARLASTNQSKLSRASDNRDPSSGPLIVQTKQEVEKEKSRKAQEPQKETKKRPLSETQPTGAGPVLPVKRPRVEQASAFVDLTNQ